MSGINPHKRSPTVAAIDSWSIVLPMCCISANIRLYQAHRRVLL